MKGIRRDGLQLPRKEKPHDGQEEEMDLAFSGNVVLALLREDTAVTQLLHTSCFNKVHLLHTSSAAFLLLWVVLFPLALVRCCFPSFACWLALLLFFPLGVAFLGIFLLGVGAALGPRRLIYFFVSFVFQIFCHLSFIVSLSVLFFIFCLVFILFSFLFFNLIFSCFFHIFLEREKECGSTRDAFTRTVALSGFPLRTDFGVGNVKFLQERRHQDRVTHDVAVIHVPQFC